MQAILHTLAKAWIKNVQAAHVKHWQRRQSVARLRECLPQRPRSAAR